MFDAHSYSKGGLVLYMLREYLGKEIFYKGLNTYLTDNAYGAVEVHHLRLAMEKASGEDLNWFFNQWFLSPGHPVLEVEYAYNEVSLSASVSIKQVQTGEDVPAVFRLPIKIDLYTQGGKMQESVWLTEAEQKFYFKTDAKPYLINIDPGKTLLCEIIDDKGAEAYAYQYRNAGNYMDKLEALQKLEKSKDKDISKEIMLASLNDPFYDLRRFAVQNIELKDEVKSSLAELAQSDKKSLVRADAITRLAETEDKNFLDLYKKSLIDSSLAVVAEALQAISAIDDSIALSLALPFEEFNNYSVVSAVSLIYATTGDDDKQQYFEDKVYETTSYARYEVVSNYGVFLKGKSDAMLQTAITTLKDIAINSAQWWDRMGAATTLFDLKETKKAPGEMSDLLTKTIDEVIAAEKNKRLKLRYEMLNPNKP